MARMLWVSTQEAEAEGQRQVFKETGLCYRSDPPKHPHRGPCIHPKIRSWGVMEAGGHRNAGYWNKLCSEPISSVPSLPEPADGPGGQASWRAAFAP